MEEKKETKRICKCILYYTIELHVALYQMLGKIQQKKRCNCKRFPSPVSYLTYSEYHATDRIVLKVSTVS